MALKRGKLIYIILGIVIVLVIAALAYVLLYTSKCSDMNCFKTNLWECKKASFTNYEENSTWQYIIRGMSGGECQIDVKAISLQMDVSIGSLQGKTMTCYIPRSLLGSFMPEEKLEYCHGILKEEIQKLIIEKLHLYIAQNIGQINQTTII